MRLLRDLDASGSSADELRAAVARRLLDLDSGLIGGLAAYRRHEPRPERPEHPVLWREGASRLLDHAPALLRLGLEIEGFGPGAVMVRALPALLGAPEPGPLLEDLADGLAEWKGAEALEARIDAAIARLACHGSVRAGRRLNTAEMSALLRAMEATPRAATCSHGRPTFLRMDKPMLEKMFGRR